MDEFKLRSNNILAEYVVMNGTLVRRHKTLRYVVFLHVSSDQESEDSDGFHYHYSCIGDFSRDESQSI